MLRGKDRSLLVGKDSPNVGDRVKAYFHDRGLVQTREGVISAIERAGKARIYVGVEGVVIYRTDLSNLQVALVQAYVPDRQPVLFD